MRMNLQTPLRNYKFDLRATPDDKYRYGEIYTPLRLIESMFAMLPDQVFENPDTRWLDPGAGTGHFSLVLYHRLMKGLAFSFSVRGSKICTHTRASSGQRLCKTANDAMLGREVFSPILLSVLLSPGGKDK